MVFKMTAQITQSQASKNPPTTLNRLILTFFWIFLGPITTFWIYSFLVDFVWSLQEFWIPYTYILWQFIFNVPPWLRKVTSTENCKNANVPQQICIYLKWIFLTYMNYIFELSGNTKYEFLCFMTRITKTSDCWYYKILVTYCERNTTQFLWCILMTSLQNVHSNN